MIGLAFRETMSGAYHLSSAPDVDRPMHFTVRARIDSLKSALTSPLFSLEGEIVAEGFADHKPAKGTLCIDMLRGKVLVYMIEFEGNDGEKYVFEGRKNLTEGSFLQAMTVLPGGIYRASGGEVARALLRFDLRSDLYKFLRSFRLVRS
jgi:hypothetical protein